MCNFGIVYSYKMQYNMTLLLPTHLPPLRVRALCSRIDKLQSTFQNATPSLDHSCAEPRIYEMLAIADTSSGMKRF